jgi:hypothetical protein
LRGTLAANGGGGGAGADVDTKGGDGQPGQLSDVAATGGLATGEGTAGGVGGAGLLAAGTAGTAATGNDNVSDNAGGGGAAGGRIVVRKPGNDPIMGTTSPTAGVNVLVLPTL